MKIGKLTEYNKSFRKVRVGDEGGIQSYNLLTIHTEKNYRNNSMQEFLV